MSDTIIVFTAKTTDEILQAGGSQAWVLKAANARKMRYLVCTRNANGSDGPEPHRAGFMIGRISGVVPAPDAPGRYLIQIKEWAPIDRTELWTFGRNPVHYVNLSDPEVRIDPETIEFEPMPESEQPGLIMKAGGTTRPLTIAEAKRGLAAALGVGVDAIEITIHA